MWWFIGFIGVYLVLGVLTAAIASETPYSDNGLLWIALLWPLFLYAIFFA
jgi:hypothetical protein